MAKRATGVGSKKWVLHTKQEKDLKQRKKCWAEKAGKKCVIQKN